MASLEVLAPGTGFNEGQEIDGLKGDADDHPLDAGIGLQHGGKEAGGGRRDDNVGPGDGIDIANSFTLSLRARGPSWMKSALGHLLRSVW
jgi:hypothetical protein